MRLTSAGREFQALPGHVVLAGRARLSGGSVFFAPNDFGGEEHRGSVNVHVAGAPSASQNPTKSTIP
jgi:hypothetical protein